jgi:hypothetical protein
LGDVSSARCPPHTLWDLRSGFYTIPLCSPQHSEFLARQFFSFGYCKHLSGTALLGRDTVITRVRVGEQGLRHHRHYRSSTHLRHLYGKNLAPSAQYIRSGNGLPGPQTKTSDGSTSESSTDDGPSEGHIDTPPAHGSCRAHNNLYTSRIMSREPPDDDAATRLHDLGQRAGALRESDGRCMLSARVPPALHVGIIG